MTITIILSFRNIFILLMRKSEIDLLNSIE